MPKIPNFFAFNEVTKPPDERVYHNNSGCLAGKGIPPKERRAGTSGYGICEDCKELSEVESSGSSLEPRVGSRVAKRAV